MNMKQRRTQAWTLVMYSLMVLSTNLMDHGIWRKTVLVIAAALVAGVGSLMVRARLRGNCSRAGYVRTGL